MKALITGASSGIGKEIAKYLNSMGYDIIAVSRNIQELQALKKELTENTIVIEKDLSNNQNCIDLYEQVKKENIDILVNNAGFGAFGFFDETELGNEINMINTNIVAVHILTKLFLKDFIKKDAGAILNVSSLASFMPGPLMATYYSTKAYVTRMSQAIMKELSKRKSRVKISVLCPGPVKTNFNNVANVKFSMKALTSEYVAKYAIDQLLIGKKIIIPGFSNKLARIMAKLMPSSLVASVTYSIQHKKIK